MGAGTITYQSSKTRRTGFFSANPLTPIFTPSHRFLISHFIHCFQELMTKDLNLPPTFMRCLQTQHEASLNKMCLHKAALKPINLENFNLAVNNSTQLKITFNAAG